MNTGDIALPEPGVRFHYLSGSYRDAYLSQLNPPCATMSDLRAVLEAGRPVEILGRGRSIVMAHALEEAEELLYTSVSAHGTRRTL